MELKELSKIHNWNLPIICPICDSKLKLSENHCQLKCCNEYCDSKNVGRINKWTNILDIKEFGERTIEILLNNNIISTISSLYKIDYNKIANLNGFGIKSANIIKKELESKNKITLAKFIAGYNIEGIGEKILENIISKYNINTLDDILNIKSFECNGIGEITSKKLYEGLHKLSEDMKKTLNYINIVNNNSQTTDGKLNNKSFCFTGAASLPRKELHKMVIDNGGIIFDGIKNNLDYLVLADINSTSSKANKARKNGIKLITENDFFNMCK